MDKFKDETILLASDWKIPEDWGKPSGWGRHSITCRTENVEENHIKVVLKGMCEISNFDPVYVLNWEPLSNNPWEVPSYRYKGLRNSSIKYLGDEKWAISDGYEHDTWKKDQTKMSK